MIVVENLNFSYQDKTVLRNLNFQINVGQWVSIIGDNGSGKSTLAKILIGLLPLQKGNIFINNLSLKEDNLSYVRKIMGIIFQNPDYQFVGFDVRSDIAFGLENQSLSREEIWFRIDKYARMLGIESLLDLKPQELSGGQKQKVAIAAVLAMEPKIIILDEPTAFLDPQGTKEIHDIIKTIHQSKDKILITITHDLAFALKSDKIMVIEKGTLWQYDSPQSLLKKSVFVEKFFLHLPFVLRLYYQLQEEQLLKANPQSLIKLKDLLWEYSLQM